MSIEAEVKTLTSAVKIWKDAYDEQTVRAASLEKELKAEKTTSRILISKLIAERNSLVEQVQKYENKAIVEEVSKN